ncbi:MAG TPA: ferritin-like domain-containing protein [Acidimicrobiales bacterium]|nr:ferritin-like domain-containing protein [Acidimicrobiales bacterium]
MTPAQTEPRSDKEEPRGFSRRGFLVATGAVAASAVVLAACGGDDDDSSSGTDTTDAPDTGSSDADIAKLAAGLEVLAVGTYKAALDAATAGKLGAVPPAVATFAKTALAHHEKALSTWNGVLTGAGATAVTTPPADLKATVDSQFAKVTDSVGVAKLALMLEQIAADTYLSAVPKLKDKTAITTAGTFQTLDQEHVAILLFVLGQYPVPDVFQKTTNAYAG